MCVWKVEVIIIQLGGYGFWDLFHEAHVAYVQRNL